MLEKLAQTLEFKREAAYVNGQWIAADNGKTLPVTNPATGELIGSVPNCGKDETARAIAAADAAFPAWRAKTAKERAKILHKLADLVEANADALGVLLTVEQGKSLAEARGEVVFSAAYVRWFAEEAQRVYGDVIPSPWPGRRILVTKEPVGVVGAITPWNFPLNMAGWKLGPALAAGNAVVLKPSEMTPFATLYLAQLSVRAGLPAGLINIVLGDGRTTGTAITGHPDIAKVSFTGSTAAGAAIMENIARTGIKPMTLELGGKSPQLVFADADLPQAAAAIARSILGNAGQACVAGSRLIVAESVAEQLVALIVERMSAVRPGATWDAASAYSPIISERQIGRMESIVDAAVARGATCRLGGERLDHAGYFYAPTVLERVDATSPAVTEEIFGPILTVQTFREEEEGLGLADHPTYGLCAGLYTRDLSRALRAVNRLQAGTVWVNRYGRSRDHILPTGGYKQSGLGKDLGREAYLANRKSKSVLIAL